MSYFDSQAKKYGGYKNLEQKYAKALSEIDKNIELARAGKYDSIPMYLYLEDGTFEKDIRKIFNLNAK